MVVPGTATTTFCPSATLGAPHTMVLNSSLPISTLVTLSLSAPGCLATSFTLPITKPFRPPSRLLNVEVLSTSKPMSVKISAAFFADKPHLQT
jgi:hypothetical protein